MSSGELCEVLQLVFALWDEEDHMREMMMLPSLVEGQMPTIPVPWDRVGVDSSKYIYPKATVDESRRYLTKTALAKVHPFLPTRDVDHSFGCSLIDIQWILAQKIARMVRAKSGRLLYDHKHVCSFTKKGKKKLVCDCRTFTVPGRLLLVPTLIDGKVRQRLHLCTPYCNVHVGGVTSEVFHPNSKLLLSVDPIFCDTSLRYHVCGTSCQMRRATGGLVRLCPLGGSPAGGMRVHADDYKATTGTLAPPPPEITTMQHHNALHRKGLVPSRSLPFQALDPEWPTSARVYNKILVDADKARHLYGAFPVWVVPRNLALQSWPPSKIDEEGNRVVDFEEKKRIIRLLYKKSKGLRGVVMTTQVVGNTFSGGIARTVPLFVTKRQKTARQTVISQLNARKAQSQQGLYKRASTLWCAVYEGSRVFANDSNLATARTVVHALLFSEYRLAAEESISDTYYPVKYIRRVLSSPRGARTLHLWTLCIALEILCFRNDLYASVVRWGLLPDGIDKTPAFVYFVLCEMFARKPSMYVQQISPASYLPAKEMIANDGGPTSLGWVHGTLSKLTKNEDVDTSAKPAIATTLEMIFRLEEVNGGFEWTVPSVALQDMVEWVEAYEDHIEPPPADNVKVTAYMDRMECSVADWYLSSFCSAKRQVSPMLSMLTIRDDRDYFRRQERAANRAAIAQGLFAGREVAGPSRKTLKRIDGSGAKKEGK